MIAGPVRKLDKYQNFEELSRNESDFGVEVCDRSSDVTIIAPHGGRIEPNSSEIAALIAGDTYNLFCFNGLKADRNHELHITSHRFDHPRALELVGRSGHVIAVHGCTVNRPVAYLGGLDTLLIDRISRELSRARIDNERCPPRFRGTHRDNICNRSRFGRGVQLELSRGIRDHESTRQAVATAVRSAISTIKRAEAGALPLR